MATRPRTSACHEPLPRASAADIARRLAAPAALAVLVLLGGPPRAFAQYTWTDENGFHIADSIEKVPEQYRQELLEEKQGTRRKKKTSEEGGAPGNAPAGDEEIGTGAGRRHEIEPTPTPAPSRPREKTDDVQTVRESWVPFSWVERGRSTLAVVFLLGLAMHCGRGFVLVRRSRYLKRALAYYERYLATRNRSDPDLEGILETEAEMERVRTLVRKCRPGTSKMRLTEEAPGTGGATSGVVDVVRSSLSQSEAVTHAFGSLLRQTAGAVEYEARRFYRPLALADLAVHLPRHLMTGFGTRRLRSERWVRLFELVYWAFAIVCVSVWT